MADGKTHNPALGDSVIAANDIPAAVTRAPFAYRDGSTQVFTTDGKTTYNDRGRPTFGTWGVTPEGRFWSVWAGGYRAEYDVTWIGEPGALADGVRFVDVNSSYISDGRYSRANDFSTDANAYQEEMKRDEH